MANRAFLQCFTDAGPAPRFISCSNSLADGWLDLFVSGELHVGPDCPLPGATKEHTTSYLLAEAPVALARFAERMSTRKVPLHGDGLTARLFAFLEEHFGTGHLFVDTSELEAMRAEGWVTSTKRALDMAAKKKRARELTPAGLLVEWGWGTGLSAEEVTEAIAKAKANPFDVSAMDGRPYSIRETFHEGERVAHKVFGEGVVRSATLDAVTIAFPIGLKTLAHGRT